MNAAWMIAASLLFACMGVCVKLGAERFHAAELVFWRGTIAMLIVGLWVARHRLPLWSVHWKLHLRRSVSGTCALTCYFIAITQLPLATAVTLNYTSPLFLALLLTLHEPTRRSLWFALGLGFGGVALVLQPTLSAGQEVGALIGLASGLLSSFAYFNLKALGTAGEPEWRTVFWFSLVCAAAGLPFALAHPHASGYTPADLGVMLGVGGFGALAQIALTRAYIGGRTLATASLAYTTVVFASLFGALVFGDSIAPHAWLGIGVIVVAGILASSSKTASADKPIGQTIAQRAEAE